MPAPTAERSQPCRIAGTQQLIRGRVHARDRYGRLASRPVSTGAGCAVPIVPSGVCVKASCAGWSRPCESRCTAASVDLVELAGFRARARAVPAPGRRAVVSRPNAASGNALYRLLALCINLTASEPDSGGAAWHRGSAEEAVRGRGVRRLRAVLRCAALRPCRRIPRCHGGAVPGDGIRRGTVLVRIGATPQPLLWHACRQQSADRSNSS